MPRYKRVIFFDLDGTLLNSKSLIASSTIEAISEIDRSQTLVAIATGRSHQEIKNIKELLTISTVVHMNGQHVEFEGNAIYSKEFSMKECQNLIRISDERRCPVIFLRKNESTINFINSGAKYYIEKKNVIMPKVRPLYDDLNQTNMAILISDNKNDEKFFSERMTSLNFIRTGSHCIDIVNIGISKSTGIKKILDLIPYDLETICFGDSFNDLEMFQLCSTKIAMGNAVDQLKKMADFITTTNDEDGIKNGLKFLKII